MDAHIETLRSLSHTLNTLSTPSTAPTPSDILILLDAHVLSISNHITVLDKAAAITGIPQRNELKIMSEQAQNLRTEATKVRNMLTGGIANGSKSVQVDVTSDLKPSSTHWQNEPVTVSNSQHQLPPFTSNILKRKGIDGEVFATSSIEQTKRLRLEPPMPTKPEPLIPSTLRATDTPIAPTSEPVSITSNLLPMAKPSQNAPEHTSAHDLGSSSSSFADHSAVASDGTATASATFSTTGTKSAAPTIITAPPDVSNLYINQMPIPVSQTEPQDHDPDVYEDPTPLIEARLAEKREQKRREKKSLAAGTMRKRSRRSFETDGGMLTQVGDSDYDERTNDSKDNLVLDKAGNEGNVDKTAQGQDNIANTVKDSREVTQKDDNTTTAAAQKNSIASIGPNVGGVIGVGNTSTPTPGLSNVTWTIHSPTFKVDGTDIGKPSADIKYNAQVKDSTTENARGVVNGDTEHNKNKENVTTYSKPKKKTGFPANKKTKHTHDPINNDDNPIIQNSEPRSNRDRGNSNQIADEANLHTIKSSAMDSNSAK
jgi:hypothetical protein